MMASCGRLTAPATSSAGTSAPELRCDLSHFDLFTLQPDRDQTRTGFHRQTVARDHAAGSHRRDSGDSRMPREGDSRLARK